MINCDAVKQGILDIITAEFFSRMMLSYSFPTINLYNVLHFVEFGVDPYYRTDDNLYDRKYQMERSNRRINRIAERLKEERGSGVGSGKDCAGAIFKPKYYDSIMCEEMVRAYNQICELFGRTEVKPITKHLIQRACIEETVGFCDYDDCIVKCGYSVDIRNIKRTSVTLPEVIFYTSTYMSTSTRSLWTLNRELIKKTDYSRALRWYDRYMGVFKERTVYDAVVWEIFDMLFEKAACDYEDLCGLCIQKFWLDEKYRDRKDRKRVLKKLEKITEDGTVSRAYLEKQLEKYPERSDDFGHTYNSISLLEILLCDILPYAEMIALGRMARPTEDEWMHAEKIEKEFHEKEIRGELLKNECLNNEYEKDRADYEDLQFREVAAWLADHVLTVVNVSFGIAEKMLHGLPEAIAWRTVE